MDQSRIIHARTLGMRLRALRKSRGLTLARLAQKMGRSVGWLSQVERDISDLSINELQQLVEVLDHPISNLFGHASGPAEEQGYVLRANARRRMGSEQDGLIEEILSPDLTNGFELIHSTFPPHSSMQRPAQRLTQEVGYIISGHLDLKISGRSFTVGSGDSFRLMGEPFTWANPYEEPCVAIRAIMPQCC